MAQAIVVTLLGPFLGVPKVHVLDRLTTLRTAENCSTNNPKEGADESIAKLFRIYSPPLWHLAEYDGSLERRSKIAPRTGLGMVPAGRSRRNAADAGRHLFKGWPNVANIGPHFAEVGPNLADTGEFWPNAVGRHRGIPPKSLPEANSKQCRSHFGAMFKYFVVISAALPESSC